MSVSEMKRFLLILSVLFASGAVCGARSLAPEALGTVKYAVRYKMGALNTKVATASISFEKGEWDDEEVYHSKASIKTTPVFRLFLGSDYVAETWLDRRDLAPVHFVNPFTKKKFAGVFEYDYDADSRTIESLAVTSPQDSVRTTFPLDGRTMDLLSLLHDVRFRKLSPSDAPIQMHVLMGGKSFAATLSCAGPDPDKVPDRESEEFVVKLTERGLMENGSGNEIHIWRSCGDDRRILILEAVLSSGFMSVTIQE